MAETKDAIERGRLVDPQASAFYRAEALLQLKQGNFEPAKKAILAAIDTDPTGPRNALVLGEISYHVKDLESAKAALEEAAKNPDIGPRPRYFLARVAYDLDDFQTARKDLRQVLKRVPMHVSAIELLGDVAVKEKKAQEAINQYRIASRFAQVASAETNREVFVKLGRLFEKTGKTRQAQESFLMAYHYGDRSDLVKQKTESADRSEAALKALESKLTMGKADFLLRAETFLTQKKYRESFQYLQAAHVLAPSDGEVLLKMGELIESRAVYFDEFLRVVGFYERAIDNDPTLAKAYIKLGLLETEQYNLERAYQLLRQAKALEPDARDTHVAMGKHFYKRQDFNKALDEFIRASKIKKQDSEVLYFAGKMRLLFSKDPREAMVLFEQSYKADPFNHDALVQWLKLKVETFDKNFAIKFVKNLLQKEPKNPKYYWALGEIFTADKNYLRAIRNLKEARDLDDKDSKIRMSLGDAYRASNRKKEAIIEYQTASRLDRRNMEGYYNAAELLIEQRRYTEAEKILGELLETSPRYPGAHRYLARVLKAKNKSTDAVKTLRKEVELNPLNVKFRIELAELLMHYKEYEQAVTELTEITNLPSLSKAPEFIYDKIRGYLLLSRCYRALGRYESAEGAIRLAIEIDAEDPLLHRELGYVYVALQRNKDAAAAFNTYLKRSPAAQDAGTIKKLINRLVIPE